MLQTNIAASSPVLPASPGPAAAGEGKAAAPEGAAESFANVLGQQKRDQAAKTQADTPADDATPAVASPPQPTDAAAVPWLLPPPAADWFASAQAALLGKQGATADRRPGDDADATRADSGEAGALILAALPTPGPAGAGATADPSSLRPTDALGEGGARRLPPTPAPTTTARPTDTPATLAATASAPATGKPVSPFAIAGATGDSPAPLSANLAATPAADTATRDIGDIVATAAASTPKLTAPATDFQPRAPEPDTSLAAPTLMPAHPGADLAAATGHADLHIATPVGGRQWESAVGNSLVLMTGNRQQHAELVLTPPQLGRIEVSLSMTGDQATAVFVSPNPAVRDALESAMPRLREILADAGVTLGQVQVGAESFRQSAGNRENGDNPGRTVSSGRFGDIGSARVIAAIGTSATGATRSLVDVFV